MSKKIVIVAGAGANRDFTITNNPEKFFFPSGEELVNKIATNESKFSSKNLYHRISRIAEYYRPFSIDELIDSIKKNKIFTFPSLEYSSPIEDFMAQLFDKKIDPKKKIYTPPPLIAKIKREELIQAGKELIAYHLLKSEKTKLFENIDAKIWYCYIRNLIITGKDDAEISKNIVNITIISFNYDRSLDYYLRTRLDKYYSQIQKRIFYPYGKLSGFL